VAQTPRGDRVFEKSKGMLLQRGQGSPSVSTLIELARAFGLEVKDFFAFQSAAFGTAPSSSSNARVSTRCDGFCDSSAEQRTPVGSSDAALTARGRARHFCTLRLR